MTVIAEWSATVAFGALRPHRNSLLASTALGAAFLCMIGLPASAQPAPNARPVGEHVVAGAASFGRTLNATTIDQSTQRAAINWQSFDVGGNQTVTFNQPSGSSMTLNRVVGPDPSAIAGKITANGGIVITNQSGVVFYPGSQVDATSVVVSAPGITNKNFMAGKLVFDRPAKPGAAVVNQGNITIKQAGLGALVAPQVRNAGTINATLGHVVLAGAEAATLDMYGDGLVSIDVTKQVTKAPGGGAALVTNTGTISADGGTVQLTAAAVDGIVKTLVQSCGSIYARTIGAKTGTITIGGTGGALVVEGQVVATGTKPGTRGGAIEVAGTGDVELASTARLDASGQAGGGVIAVGTTIARATGGQAVAPKVVSRNVHVTKGARIAVDATDQGKGGTVTLLSTQSTAFDGGITARGGANGGDGGFVELSGKIGLGLTGSVDASAPRGNLGDVLLDPGTLIIVALPAGCGSVDSILVPGGVVLGNQPDTTSTQTVSNAAIESITANILLQATNLVSVQAPIALTTTGQSLTIQSGGDLLVTVNAAISALGNVTLEANVPALRVLGSGLLPGLLRLDSSVTSTSGTVTLNGNSIITTAAVSATAGNVNLAAGSVAIGGALQAGSGGTVVLQSDNLSIRSPINVPGGTVEIAPFTSGHTVSIDNSAPTNNPPTNLSLVAADLQNIHTSGGTLGIGFTQLSGTVAGGVTINGNLDLASVAGTLDLESQGAITETGGTLLNVGTLTAHAGSVLSLANANTVETLGGLNAADASLEVNVAGDVVVNGQVSNFGNFSCAVVTAPITIRAGRNLTVAATEGPTIESTGAMLLAAGTSDATGGLTITGFLQSSRGGMQLSAAGGGMTIGAPVKAGSSNPGIGIPGQVLSIRSDGHVAFPGAALFADGGTIEIAPATAGRAMTLGGSGLGSSVDQIPIGTDANAPATPSLVRFGGVMNPAGTVVTQAASLDFVANPFLNGPALPTLELDASGNVTEHAGVSITNVSRLVGTVGTLEFGSTGNQILSVGPFTTSTGDLVLTDGTALSVVSLLQAGNGHTLSLTAPSINIAGPAADFSGSLLVQPDTSVSPVRGGTILLATDSLAATGTIQAPSGLVAIAPLTAGNTLSVDATQRTTPGVLSLTPGLLSEISTSGGTLALGSTSAGATTSAGAVSINTPLDLTGTAGTLGLYATGLVTQSAGSGINVGTLIGPAVSPGITPNGAVTLADADNNIASLGPLATSGSFVLNDASGLTVVGAIDPGDVTIDTMGNLVIAESITGNKVDLIAGGAITEVRLGQVTAGTLTGSAASAAFGNQNAVSTLGSFTTTNGFSLTNAVPLTVTGPVSDGSTVALSNQGAITLAGDVTAPLVTLAATGAIAQPSGTLTAGTLTGSAASAAFGNQNGVSTLGSFTTTTGFSLTNAVPLTVTGPVSDGSSVALSNQGAITLAGDVTAPLVTLAATGAIAQPSGTLTAGTLTGSAALAAFGNQNAVSTLGSFTTTTGFSLTNAVPLTVTGPVSDGSSVALSNQGAITLAGGVTAPLVTLAATGAIAQPSGTLTAGTLTGSSGGAAQFGPDPLGGVASIGTLGPFSVASGSFSLADSVPLTVGGPLTAVDFQIVAPGRITLAGGTVTTTGLSVASQTGTDPAAPGSFLLVQPVGGASSFTQTGRTTIQSLPGTSATVRIDVSSAGTISFDNLVAPSATLVLGIVSGSATGAIDVGALTVLGQTGSSNLSGTVRGQNGPAAAAASRIQPAVNQNYLLNGCIIGLATCRIIPPPTGPDLVAVARNTPPTTQLPWMPIALMASGYADPAPQLPSSDRVRPETLNLGLNFPPVEPGEPSPELVLPNVSSRDY